MDAFTPNKSDRFSFGLWTVGNPGRDPFGPETRVPMRPTYIVQKLSECGAYGVNLHDNDLVPFGASAAQRDTIVREFKGALEDNGMVVPMATTNLFSHPVFKDGSFSSNDPKVRAFALRKTMEAIDLGVELGAKIYVFWGGREGTEADACRDPRAAIARTRDAIDYLCEYVRDQRYELVLRARGQAQRAARRHLLPDHGPHAALHLDAGAPRDGRRQPRGGAREHVRPVVRARRGAGDGVRQALPHRPQRAEDRALRPGPALRLRGRAAGLPARAPARRHAGRRALHRPAALRQPRLPHRGRGRRVGVRARLDAHVQDPQGQGAGASTPIPRCAR